MYDDDKGWHHTKTAAREEIAYKISSSPRSLARELRDNLYIQLWTVPAFGNIPAQAWYTVEDKRRPIRREPDLT